jgi:hypothetical protein
MKKKPSSIEWLVDQFKEYDFSEEDGMYLIKIPSWLLAEKEEKAKAMHKEEIIDAYRRGFISDDIKLADDYYNETFGGEGERHK